MAEELNPITFSQLVDIAREALENPPETVEINITLTGGSAARWHLSKTLIMNIFGVDDARASEVLVQLAAEENIKKFVGSAFPND